MEGDDTNVHSLNIPKDADAAASDKVVRQAPTIAKMRKALFDAYVAEGFTADQAIKLLCMWRCDEAIWTKALTQLAALLKPNWSACLVWRDHKREQDHGWHLSDLSPRAPLANAAYPHATASARSAVRSAKPISVGSW